MDRQNAPAPRRIRPTAGTPQIECPSCRMPVLLTFVERDGDARWLTCPYCDRRDEWSVDEGS